MGCECIHIALESFNHELEEIGRTGGDYLLNDVICIYEPKSRSLAMQF